MIGSRSKSLLVFVEDTDTWEEQPLYEAIVRLLHRNHVAGATVWSGVMGYGAHGRIHRRGLFGVADEKPIMIMAIDAEEKLRAVLPELLSMVNEGAVVLQDAEVFVRGEDTPSQSTVKSRGASPMSVFRPSSVRITDRTRQLNLGG
jgi:uncharacterized protein